MFVAISDVTSGNVLGDAFCVRRKVGAGVVICGDEEGTCINLQHPYVEFKEIVVKVFGEKVGSVIIVADNLLV